MLPLQFMYCSHSTPQPHQTMCSSVTGVPVAAYLVSAAQLLGESFPFSAAVFHQTTALCKSNKGFSPNQRFFVLYLLYYLYQRLSTVFQKFSDFFQSSFSFHILMSFSVEYAAFAGLVDGSDTAPIPVLARHSFS